MKLYGTFTSPYVRHCRIALIEEGLDCEFHKADPALSAELSPMQKVPFALCDYGEGEKVLSDSTAILKCIRQTNNKAFLHSVEEMNRYLAASTMLDAAINLFFLEKDGLSSQQSPYLARQQSRIETGLVAFEGETQTDKKHLDDADLRLACFLEWAQFRKRVSLGKYPQLQDFLLNAQSYEPFSSTSPAE